MKRLAVNALVLGHVAVGKTLVNLGLRAEPDGWRTTVGTVLRQEPSKFALSAFGLGVPGDGPDLERRLAAGLRAFLANEPDARYRVAHTAWFSRREPLGCVDVVLQRFGPDGELLGVAPFLDPAHPADIPEAGPREIAAAFNQTRHLPEDVRPLALRRLVGRDPLAHRLLGAACLSFEEPDAGHPAGRFRPPAFRLRRTLGDGMLSFVARPDRAAGTADLWMNIHHAAMDGAAMQELVTRLERSWGVRSPVAFPDPDDVADLPTPRSCSAPGEREVFEVLDVLDFSPLLAFRKAANARLGAEVGGELTFGCALAWCLSREPEFAGKKFAATVDVPAAGGFDRDVDFVAARPPEGGGDRELAAFAREFNRLVAAARSRSGPTRDGGRVLGLLPHRLRWHAIRLNGGAIDETFGTVGLSVLRDARVFVAPLSDTGFGDGLITIGNVGLPSRSGRPVGFVSAKGPREKVAAYPAVFRRVLGRLAAGT